MVDQIMIECASKPCLLFGMNWFRRHFNNLPIDEIKSLIWMLVSKNRKLLCSHFFLRKHKSITSQSHFCEIIILWITPKRDYLLTSGLRSVSSKEMGYGAAGFALFTR